MSREDFDAAVGTLEEAGLAVRFRSYDHEIMGSWLVEVEGPAGVWMLVYDGRDHAFVTRRESAPGVWEVIWTDTDAGAFARSLRRVVDRARR